MILKTLKATASVSSIETFYVVRKQILKIIIESKSTEAN